MDRPDRIRPPLGGSFLRDGVRGPRPRVRRIRGSAYAASMMTYYQNSRGFGKCDMQGHLAGAQGKTASSSSDL